MDGAASSLREGPGDALETLRRAFEAAKQAGREDRTPVERVFDTLLDAFADVPGAFHARATEAFDRFAKESGA